MIHVVNTLAHNTQKENSIPTKLTKGDVNLSGGNEIWEYFNEFFATIGAVLAKSIQTTYLDVDACTTAKIINKPTNTLDSL